MSMGVSVCFNILKIFKIKKSNIIYKGPQKLTKAGKLTKSSQQKKPITSHNKIKWLFGLDDETRISFLERLIQGDSTINQIAAIARKHKVLLIINNLVYLL